MRTKFQPVSRWAAPLALIALACGAYFALRTQPAQAASSRQIIGVAGPMGVAREQTLLLRVGLPGETSEQIVPATLTLRNANGGAIASKQINLVANQYASYRMDVNDDGQIFIDGNFQGSLSGDSLDVAAELKAGLPKKAPQPVGSLQLIDTDSGKTQGIIAVLIGL